MATIFHDVNDNAYRWAVWLLIATSVATMIGRISSVTATTGESPMLSANDRSRWCTIRTLVEDGSYVIDRLVAIKHKKTGRRFWKSIDMVRHRGHDQKEHYYSSKPTLLPTMLAGEYWLIRRTTGASLGAKPFLVMRLMLVITNVLPLFVYFVVLWKLLEKLTTNRLAILYTMAAATWATFLTTFAVTLNNHTVAAISVLLATVLILHIWLRDQAAGSGVRLWLCYAGAGLFAAFTAANEMPALAFLAAAAVAVAWQSIKFTLFGFLPATLLVAAGFFGTNYLAHGTYIPAYAHRSDGPVVAQVSRDLAKQLDQRNEKPVLDPIRDAMAKAKSPSSDQALALSKQALTLVERKGERWAIWDRDGHHRYAIVRGDGDLEIRTWENWYDYRGSYWTTERQGVDRGESSRIVYACHSLIGHRGVFSLTPIWLLAIEGMVLLVLSRNRTWTLYGVMVIALTLVCLAFYLTRPTIDRNYGGVCCGFRWMFWFTPLWLVCVVPAAERLTRGPVGRTVAIVLLILSVFSATYAAANPWSQPWLFDLGTYAGWWKY